MKKPVIESNGFFIITFYRHVVKDVPKMSLNVPKKERLEYIVNKIKSKEPFTSLTLAKELNVNEKTIDRDIEELKKVSKIKFVGPKRSGHYEIIKP